MAYEDLPHGLCVRHSFIELDTALKSERLRSRSCPPRLNTQIPETLVVNKVHPLAQELVDAVRDPLLRYIDERFRVAQTQMECLFKSGSAEYFSRMDLQLGH